jgi:hypothetical protein
MLVRDAAPLMLVRARFCGRCRNSLQPTAPLPQSDLPTAFGKAFVRNLIIGIAFIVIFGGIGIFFLLIYLFARAM